MKYKIIAIALVCGSILSVSCNKNLDETPVTDIDYRTALKTSDDVLAALVGAYRDFGVSSFYGGRVFMESDFLANDDAIDWYGTYQGLTQIYNKSIPVDDIFISDVWLAGYKAINDVNGVLDSLNLVTQSERQRAEGEAKFIRGASYFQLVKMFAKAYNDGDPTANPGVPLVLSSTGLVTDANKLKRNTVAEVYQQVIKDLTDAASLLPERNQNGLFADQAAANAMLARVYLQMDDYAKALTASNDAITIRVANNGGLMPSYADAFGASNTAEDIFDIQVTSTSGTQGFNEFYSSSQRGEAVIDDAYLDTYSDSDDRKNLFYKDAGSWYTGKFEELYGNVHIIRLAEMYLVRAECNFRLGSSVGDSPVNDVNRIRKRAHLAPLGSVTLDEILEQRRLELDFEGLKLDDVKRLKGSVGSIQWNSPKLIFPIPKRELLANPNLTQNEGY